jgi:NADH-quinone oxidoreductase subunit N
MSAPLIWIGIPGLTSILLWFMRKRERASLISGLAISFFLVILTFFSPIGKPLLKISSFTLQISPSIEILGRKFSFSNGDLIFTAFIFIILFLFLCMSLIIEIPAKFVSLSFLITSIVLASLSVQPFLYAALLLEIAVLLSIMLLANGGELPTVGVIRFLIFQSLAMPIMLAAGWVLSAVEANPSEPTLILQALGLIGLGFAFWLAIFPFNFWMPQLAGEKSPFLVGFVLLLFNSAILILVMRFLDGFVWLRDDTRIFLVLRYLGVLMVASGSLLFLIEMDRKKTLSYLVSFQTGLALLALSINMLTGWNLFIIMFLPRIVSIFTWSASLAYIEEGISADAVGSNDLRIPTFVWAAIWFSGLTIVGFPLTAGFTIQTVLLTSLAKQDLVSFYGLGFSTGLLILGFIRFIHTLNSQSLSLGFFIMSKTEKAFFIILSGLLFLLGLFPQILLNGFLVMLEAFPNLK